MELYVHKAGKEDPDLVEFEPTETVAGVGGESADGAAFDLWREDEEEPLDPSQTLEQAGIGDSEHVHRSCCRRIAVTVRPRPPTRPSVGSGSASVDRRPAA